MSYVYIGGADLRLKKYGASTVGPKTTVRIEVEVTNTYALANLLKELGELTSEQKPAAKPSRPRQLLLTHDGGSRS